MLHFFHYDHKITFFFTALQVMFGGIIFCEDCPRQRYQINILIFKGTSSIQIYFTQKLLVSFIVYEYVDLTKNTRHVKGPAGHIRFLCEVNGHEACNHADHLSPWVIVRSLHPPPHPPTPFRPKPSPRSLPWPRASYTSLGGSPVVTPWPGLGTPPSPPSRAMSTRMHKQSLKCIKHFLKVHGNFGEKCVRTLLLMTRRLFFKKCRTLFQLHKYFSNFINIKKMHQPLFKLHEVS